MPYLPDKEPDQEHNLNKPMGKLLIIAFYFPPAAVVGTNRIVRFVKYLPLFNWDTRVVTVKESYFDIQDNSVQVDTQHCAIYRTEMKEITNIRRKYVTTEENGQKAIGLEVQETRSPLKKFFQHLFSIPDTRSGWISQAVRTSLNIMDQDQIDAVMSSSFPYSAHIIGWILKLLRKKYWIADFRDPWSEYAFLFPDTNFHRTIASYLEKKVVAAADAVIANTQPARDRLQERYPQYSSKIHFVTNGFDQEEHEEARLLPQNKMDSDFILLHAGTVQSGKERRYPVHLFQAISLFLDQYPQLRHKLKLKFIGHIHHKNDLQKLGAEYGIEDNIIQVGWVNQLRSLREMQIADILLLIHHAQEPISKLYSTVPAKTYEYMASKVPILCLSSHGLVGQIVEDMGYGITVNPTNTEAIKSSIENLYFHNTTWKKRLQESSGELQHFEAKHLTSELVKLLPRRETKHADI